MSVEEKVANAREVLADVGRLAARWILWSRKRLGLTLLAVLLVGLVIGQLTGPAHPRKPAVPVTATSGPSTGIGAGQPTGRPNALPTQAPVDHSAEISTATKFVTAWASHTPAAVWVPVLRALSTPTLAAGWVGTDPAIVKATKVTGSGVWTSIEGHGAVQVPTDAGKVLVIVTPGGKVDDLTPMVPTAPAPNVASGR